MALNDKLITYGNLSTFYDNLKSHDLADKQDKLTEGQNIDITNNTISAKGYVFDETNGSMAEKYRQDVEDGGAITANVSTGLGSHAEGYNTTASGDYGAHAEGEGTTASGDYSHAEGQNAIASGLGSHAEGQNAIASGLGSHAEGNSECHGEFSHSEGFLSSMNIQALQGSNVYFSWDTDSTTLFCDTDFSLIGTVNPYQHLQVGYVLSYNGITASIDSINETNNSLTLDRSFGEGQTNVQVKLVTGFIHSSATACHLEGRESICISTDPKNSRKNIIGSHAEGVYCKAEGTAVHAEGNGCIAGGASGAHAEGFRTISREYGSHTEGGWTEVKNPFEHAEGFANVTHGIGGEGFTALKSPSADKTIHSVGAGIAGANATNGRTRRNAEEIMQNGDMYVLGVGGYDGVHIKSETGYENTKTLQEVIEAKQNTLTAGSNITISGNTISATDTTYSDATQSASGLMSATDKAKLDGLSNYTLPTASANSLGGVKVGSNLSIDANGVLSATDTTYTAGTGIDITNNVISVITATTADIEALFAPPTQPNDEIWYTTSDGNAIVIEQEGYSSFDAQIVSNTYSDGKGIIKFNNDVTEIYDTFAGYITYDYTKLTSIELPDSITVMPTGMFTGSEALVSVKLPANYTGGIQDSTFSGCISLESIELPAGTTFIGDSAFSHCTSLTSVTVPANVTNLAYGAFNGCSSLESITFEPTTPPIAGGSMFEDTNDCPIYVPSGSVSAYQAAEEWSSYASRIEAIQN